MTILKEIAGELKALDTSRNAIGKFSAIIAVLLIIVAVKMRSGSLTAAWSVLALAFAVYALNLAQWTWLIPAYRVWMGFAFVLGSIVMRVMLTVVFAVLMVPIGLWFKLTGFDPMKRKLDRSAATYWLPVEVVERARLLKKF